MTPDDAEKRAEAQLVEANAMLDAVKAARPLKGVIERFEEHAKLIVMCTSQAAFRLGACAPRYVVVDGAHRWFAAAGNDVKTLDAVVMEQSAPRPQSCGPTVAPDNEGRGYDMRFECRRRAER